MIPLLNILHFMDTVQTMKLTRGNVMMYLNRFVHIKGFNCYGWIENDSGKSRVCKVKHEPSSPIGRPSRLSKCKNCDEPKVDFYGKVVYENDCFITVDNGLYKECFLKNDVITNDIRIY
jgi:hypothetical protein